MAYFGGKMSDQAKWLKLWGSALTDPHLENLRLEDWARYVRLLLYVKCHGSMGKISFPAPFTALKSLWRVSRISDILDILNRGYPNLVHRQICNGENIVTLNIQFLNWYKYQVDSSKHRVRRHRSKRNGSGTVTVTVQEEKRRDVDFKGNVNFSSGGEIPAAPGAAPELPKAGAEWATSDEPDTPTGWALMARRLSRVEQVQSKLREEGYVTS